MAEVVCLLVPHQRPSPLRIHRRLGLEVLTKYIPLDVVLAKVALQMLSHQSNEPRPSIICQPVRHGPHITFLQDRVQTKVQTRGQVCDLHKTQLAAGSPRAHLTDPTQRVIWHIEQIGAVSTHASEAHVWGRIIVQDARHIEG